MEKPVHSFAALQDNQRSMTTIIILGDKFSIESLLSSLDLGSDCSNQSRRRPRLPFVKVNFKQSFAHSLLSTGRTHIKMRF